MGTTARNAILISLDLIVRIVAWCFFIPAWLFLAPGCFLMQLADWLHAKRTGQPT